MRKLMLLLLLATFLCVPSYAQQEGEYAANYATAPTTLQMSSAARSTSTSDVKKPLT